MNNKKRRLTKQFGFVFALLIAILLIIKACNVTVEYLEPEYKIGRDGTWYPISLYGKEKNMLGFTNELLIK